MKNLLITLCLFLLVNTVLSAQLRRLETRNGPYGGAYHINPIDICGNNPPVYNELRLRYDHCTGVPCISSNCSNLPPVQFIANLYRNGVYVTQKVQTSYSSYYQTSFTGYINQPGDYQVRIYVQGPNNSCTGYHYAGNYLSTNIIRVNQVAAVPAFNISGNSMPSTNHTFCKGIDPIIVNAAASSCENSYQISVEECNASGTATGDYGWRYTRTNLQAQNGINLETLAFYNGPLMWRYGSPTRISQGMKGGPIASTTPQYYRVTVHTWTTTDPSYKTVTGVIGILSACQTDNNPDDDFNFGDGRLAITTLINTDDQVDKDHQTMDFGKSGEQEERFTTAAIDINIAPHPLSASSLVTVKGYEGNNPIQFEVYNALGQRVFTQQSDSPQFNIQRKGLAAGIYVYRASAGEQVLGSGKLMIQ